MPRVGGCLLPGRIAQGPILGSRGAFAKKPRGGQDHVRKCSLVWTVREPHRHSWDAQLGRNGQRANVRERRLAETSSLIRWFLHLASRAVRGYLASYRDFKTCWSSTRHANSAQIETTPTVGLEMVASGPSK